MFAIVWFLIGLIIFTFFGSAVAAMMTVTVVNGGPTLKQTTNKVWRRQWPNIYSDPNDAIRTQCLSPLRSINWYRKSGNSRKVLEKKL